MAETGLYCAAFPHHAWIGLFSRYSNKSRWAIASTSPTKKRNAMNAPSHPAVVAHCDWSKDPKKRWMAVAVQNNDRWALGNPEPVVEASKLFQKLDIQRQEDGAILVGFDFPIGIPARYGALTGFPDFKSALRSFGTDVWREWYNVCQSREEISIRRPFYPYRPGGRKFDHLTDGLRLRKEQLLRRCEHATTTRKAACCLFWTLGGNQVGKGAISGWQEIIFPNIDRVRLWPFDGQLSQLTAAYDIVLAETYPGDVYSQIGLPPKSKWSKTKPKGRAFAAPALADWLDQRPVVADTELIDLVRAGFSRKLIGEDQFDAFVGLLGMLDVIGGYLVEDAPETADIKRWEGWILGQSFA